MKITITIPDIDNHKDIEIDADSVAIVAIKAIEELSNPLLSAAKADIRVLGTSEYDAAIKSGLEQISKHLDEKSAIKIEREQILNDIERLLEAVVERKMQ